MKTKLSPDQDQLVAEKIATFLNKREMNSAKIWISPNYEYRIYVKDYGYIRVQYTEVVYRLGEDGYYHVGRSVQKFLYREGILE